LNPLIPKLRQSKWASAFLDAVNVSALGLMAAVTLDLGRAILADWQTVFIAALSILITFRFRAVSSVWIVGGGSVAGFLFHTVPTFF
jgi:chromate transporter